MSYTTLNPVKVRSTAKGVRPLCAWMAAAALFVPTLVAAQVAIFDPEEGINILSMGVGKAPDYIGSNHSKAAVAPLARYYFSGPRYVQLLGPQLSVNVINDNTWQFGPQVLYRLKRGSDVHDPVVSKMNEIKGTPELGVFGGASWQLSADPQNRFGVRADVEGGKHGVEGTVTANYFLPVSRAIVLNAGGGLGLSSDKWAKTYFGVNGTDVALYPSLAGAPYVPKGGVSDLRANFGAIVHFSPTWHAGLGARYQRLQGDSADSPIVAQRGNRNQWIYGLAVAYIWQ